MAQVGLKYIVAGKLNEENGAVTYSDGFLIGPAMKVDIKINASDATVYGDDVLQESDKSFTDGTISMGVTHMVDDAQSKLLGHTKGENGEIISNSGDVAPYVGVGFYSKKTVNNKVSYRAIFLRKVMFGEPSETYQTKDKQITYQTPTIEGAIGTDNNGDWKNEQTFQTEAEAIAYLNKKVGITERIKVEEK